MTPLVRAAPRRLSLAPVGVAPGLRDCPHI
jgi:hypothetical protein